MSFSDLMSSGRGPGVIGMVMALIVLLGFGFLFMFAFDDGMQGEDLSIEAVIRNQAKDVVSFEGRIAGGKESLALAPSRLAVAKDLSRTAGDNQRLEQRVVSLKQSIESENAELARQTDAWDSYKNQYRVHARGNAKGSEIAELKTLDGTLYKNVSIREVTAVGIQIRHDEGHKRIGFEDLPVDMQDHFQFDPNQKAAALLKESQLRDVHDAEAAVAGELADEAMVLQRKKDAERQREETLRVIAGKEASISALNAEIRGLEQDLENAARAASAARAAGRMHISKSGGISSNIRRKQSRASSLRAEINQMKSRL
jgi:hypothetical protein